MIIFDTSYYLLEDFIRIRCYIIDALLRNIIICHWYWLRGGFSHFSLALWELFSDAHWFYIEYIELLHSVNILMILDFSVTNIIIVYTVLFWWNKKKNKFSWDLKILCNLSCNDFFFDRKFIGDITEFITGVFLIILNSYFYIFSLIFYVICNCNYTVPSFFHYFLEYCLE